tara:strand:+ start:208 stop:708 length:501 start_codon:yes stop_codon:yes gene_type:complete
MFAVNGILFNHESPIRGEKFVTKKVVNHAIDVMNGDRDCVLLGNLNSKRDWGYARDYMNAAKLMMGHHKPDDWVVATGECHSVRELCEFVFKYLGHNLVWEGSGIKECGLIGDRVVIRISDKFYRPSELHNLRGDPSKAKKELGWSFECGFECLIKMMIDDELSIR